MDGPRLESLRQKAGNWWHSTFFSQIAACAEWGILPSTQGLCAPADDLAVMAAFTRARGEMLAYETAQAEKKRKPVRRR